MAEMADYWREKLASWEKYYVDGQYRPIESPISYSEEAQPAVEPIFDASRIRWGGDPSRGPVHTHTITNGPVFQPGSPSHTHQSLQTLRFEPGTMFAAGLFRAEELESLMPVCPDPDRFTDDELDGAIERAQRLATDSFDSRLRKGWNEVWRQLLAAREARLQEGEAYVRKSLGLE